MTFIKLDIDGEELPADATDHALVLDQSTGLMWAVLVPGLESPASYANAASAITALDYAGHQDWRLPTPHELFGLVTFLDGQLQADIDLFPDTQANWYWTSQATPWSPNYVYAVYFCQGHVGFLTRGVSAYIRPVRSAAA